MFEIKKNPQDSKLNKSFLGIFLVLLVIFILIPIFKASFYLHIALQVAFVFLIIFAATILSNHWLSFFGATLFALPFIVFDILSLRNNSLNYLILAYISYSILLLFIIALLAKKLLSKSAIDTHLVFGVMTIYVLIGIIWSKFYFIAFAYLPGSFTGIQSLNLAHFSLKHAYEAHFDLLYFSFTTLSSLGLGDIAPAVRLTKSMTMLEALSGQLFVATIIAKVVSIWHQRDEF